MLDPTDFSESSWTGPGMMEPMYPPAPSTPPMPMGEPMAAPKPRPPAKKKRKASRPKAKKKKAAKKRPKARAKRDRKSTRLNSSHLVISYAVFCLKKKNKRPTYDRCQECRLHPG